MNGQVSVNSDLAKCISEIGIVAIIRNYPNSLLKYWRLVIIYKCRITFSYNFSSHSTSLPLLSQTSNTSSDRLLPLRLVCGRPMEGRRWSASITAKIKLRTDGIANCSSNVFNSDSKLLFVSERDLFSRLS